MITLLRLFLQQSPFVLEWINFWIALQGFISSLENDRVNAWSILVFKSSYFSCLLCLLFSHNYVAWYNIRPSHLHNVCLKLHHTKHVAQWVQLKYSCLLKCVCVLNLTFRNYSFQKLKWYLGIETVTLSVKQWLKFLLVLSKPVRYQVGNQ